MKTHRSLLLMAALGTLAACSSWTETDRPYLRTSTNLVPGPRVVANQEETVYTMAKRYHVSMDDLIVLNRLPPPYMITAGQTITLPQGVGSESGNPMVADSGIAQPLSSSGSYSSRVQVAQLDAPLFARAPADPAARAAPQPLYEDASIATGLKDKFLWPVDGPILAQYGMRNGATINDGINIAGPRGAPVQAAANGLVVYAGNEGGAFGNMVLIRHGKGIVTAYAHLDRMVVDKDSVVAKGDMIGTVGGTGDVKGPQLHFEIRRNGHPVDPMPLMPAHASSSSVLPDILPKLPSVRFE